MIRLIPNYTNPLPEPLLPSLIDGTVGRSFAQTLLEFLTLQETRLMSFDRSQWIAVITGAIALLLGVGYLLLVQLLDSRGEMIPAPMGVFQILGTTRSSWGGCMGSLFS
jgi:hypothetical protein